MLTRVGFDRFIGVVAAFILLLFASNACNHSYKVIESESRNEVVKSDLSTPKSLLTLTESYSKRLDDVMNEVLGYSEVTMNIGAPEGLLGNFVADLTLERARKESDIQVDFCILNNGGLRTSIEKGEVTRRMIFELMPFENELVVVTLDGDAMEDMLDYLEGQYKMATLKSAVPISGMRLILEDDEIDEVRMGMLEWEDDKSYTVVTSDYLLSGGDNMKFFSQGSNVVNLGIKLRDVIIDKFIELNKMNLSAKASLDGRVYVKE